MNKYYSYHNIKQANHDCIPRIIQDYIKEAEEKIYKQPNIALRSIKVELIDIHKHYDGYAKELEDYLDCINKIILKGPKLDKISIQKIEKLEDKRNVLAEFLSLIEDSMAYIIRLLLEHFSELQKDKTFLDKFSKQLKRIKKEFLLKR
ncbi:MAG: hypothetical protein GY705_17915 [Bacteroidetes bacterium]|nr:hypothetical protein [Bacteroidota bacterium]